MYPDVLSGRFVSVRYLVPSARAVLGAAGGDFPPLPPQAGWWRFRLRVSASVVRTSHLRARACAPQVVSPVEKKNILLDTSEEGYVCEDMCSFEEPQKA